MLNKYIPHLILLVIFTYFTHAAPPHVYPVTVMDNPAPGYILTDRPASEGITFYDNYGEAAHNKVFSRFTGYFINLRVTNNKLFFFSTSASSWFILDENLNIIDSVAATPPYKIDFHDFSILSNGNYLLLSIEERTVDMSLRVQDGKPNATVYNYIIQEITPSKQVVFQWSAMDHFDILDATEDVDLTQSTVDPFHINGMMIDSDGYLLIASRHMDEITKVNRTNGNIVWRLGGSKSRNNQFTFTNDTRDGLTGFSHPHDVSRLANGNFLMFDNGNLRANPFSRAVEYSVNEATRTVTKVWEYEHTPSLFAPMMGNAQRLPNGNTIIGWGTVEGMFNNTLLVTEVTPAKEVVFEMTNDTEGKYSTARYVFLENTKSYDISTTGTYNFNDANNLTNVTLDITTLAGSGNVSVEKHSYQPRYISFASTTACNILDYRWVIHNRGISNVIGTIKIELSNLGTIENKQNLRIFWRSGENKSSFAYLPTSYDNNTNTISATFSSFGEFMVCYNTLSTPTNDSPANNSLGWEINPILKWHGDPNTETYRVQIATDANFSTIIKDSSLITSSQAQFFNLNNLTKYYWRVKSLIGSCESDWSTGFAFTTLISPPNPVYPPNLSTNIAFDDKLQWSGVPNGENYRVQISETPDFKNPIMDRTLQGLLTVKFQQLKSWKNYYWRVSVSNQGFWSSWSATFSFTTVMTGVILSEPTNNISGIATSGTLKWTPLDGSVFYTVQLSQDSSFYLMDTSAAGMNSNILTYKGLKNFTKYYWRVKGGNSNVKGEWSEIWSFKTMLAAPVLILPNNKSINVSPTPLLTWKPIANASSYVVLVSTTKDFATFTTNTVSGNSYKVPLLNYGVTYYWKVRPMDKTYPGEWSEIREFKVQPEDLLVSPNLAYPNDNEYKIPVKNTKIEWEEVFNVTKYRIQVSTQSGFQSIIIDSTLLAQTDFTLNSLSHNTTYYWHLKSINDKSSSDWSETRSFTTNLISPNLISPSNGDTNIDLKGIKLIWNSSEGADYYHVQVAKDLEFLNIVSESDNTSGNLFEFSLLESGQNYFWKVLGFNTNNESDWSEVFNFTAAKITGVQDLTNISKQDNFHVFPNPAINFINIRHDNQVNFIFKLYNFLGEELVSSDNPEVVNLSQFASGLYNYSILAGNRIFKGNLIISH